MLIKIKNGKDWLTFYAEYILNRLRRDRNLSDVNSVSEARKNLEIIGDNNTTHFHDSRYLPKIDAVKELINKVSNSFSVGINGRISAPNIKLVPNSTTELTVNTVHADTTAIGNPNPNLQYYINCCTGTGDQSLARWKSATIDVRNDILSVPKLAASNIECAGDITASRVFNAVWNDYAELFPRGGKTDPGDIIMLNMNSNDENYIRATANSGRIVGVHSDEYAMLIGGDKDKKPDFNKYIPVALAGRVHVNFIGKAMKGAFVVPAEIPGYGRMYNESIDNANNIVGFLVEADDFTSKRKLKIKIG